MSDLNHLVPSEQELYEHYERLHDELGRIERAGRQDQATRRRVIELSRNVLATIALVEELGYHSFNRVYVNSIRGSLSLLVGRETL